MTDIAIPEDTARSRLHRPPQEIEADDIVRAADRFEAFRRSHPEGLVDATLERIIEHDDGHLTYVVRAEVRTTPGASITNASAWAQGSTRSDNPIVASAPLESADTLARSRALRNLGVLAGVTLADSDARIGIAAPVDDTVIGSRLASSRERAGLSQDELGKLMRERGFKWSQATVWSAEKGTRALRLSEALHLNELIDFGDAS